MGKRLRITVDEDKCQGHNRCMALAPDLFQTDDFGMASAAGDGLVPEGQEELARLAESNCPEFAITVREED